MTHEMLPYDSQGRLTLRLLKKKPEHMTRWRSYAYGTIFPPTAFGPQMGTIDQIVRLNLLYANHLFPLVVDSLSLP